MCKLLARHFKCFENGTQIRHTHQYLVRCANPFYEFCIADGARMTYTEEYDISCHTCTGKFVQPSKKPVTRSRSEPDENNPAARAAILSYVKTLCEIMEISATKWPDLPGSLPTRLRIYMGTKLETACRFDRNHYDRGAFCDCNETNEEPELHNLSAAMRQVVSRGYLFPHEATNFWGLNNRVELSWDDQAPEMSQLILQASRQGFVDQPGLDVLDTLKEETTIGNIRVIPFIKETWDLRTRMEAIMAHVNQCFITTFRRGNGTGIEGWWNHFRVIHGDDIPDDIISYELDYRMSLVYNAARLLANDIGLGFDRIIHIAVCFMNVLVVDPHDILANDAIRDIHTPILSLLLHAKPVFSRNEREWTAGGDLWSTGARYRHTDHWLRRNRDMRLADENARQDAIEKTVTPLTAEAFAALADEHRTCTICFELLEGPGEGHAAVSLNCPSRDHYVGMNCWMTFWRGKRLVEMDRHDGIMCHSCGHYKLGDWDAPMNRTVVNALDMMREQYLVDDAQFED